MKKTFILIMATILALASCTKESSVNHETTGGKFTATIDQSLATKTTLGENGLSVLWEEGDAISINGCEYTADESAATTTFSPVETEAASDETASFKYSAIYPAGLSGNVLPDVQIYKDGSIGSIPMYATSNTTDLKFKNVCAVLAITVSQNITKTVRSIEVSSSNKAMSGAFTISSDNVLELTDQGNFTNTMTLECGTGVGIPETGKTFYIAIPAGNYPDLKITVCDGSNNYSMTTLSGTVITVERNHMYPITFKAQTTEGNPFRITALEGCRVTLTGCLANNNLDGADTDTWTQNPIDFMASKDGGKTWTYNDSGDMMIWLNKGESLIIKSVESKSWLGFEDLNPMSEDPLPTQFFSYFFIESGNAKVSGEFITLLNRAENDKAAGDYTFAFLFMNNPKLVSAKDLILPDNVGYRCYHSTFLGCGSLKDAPVLPATSLASECYNNMFYDCHSLESVTMLATKNINSSNIGEWLHDAGTEVAKPIMYVDPTMVSNETLKNSNTRFTLKAYK